MICLIIERERERERERLTKKPGHEIGLKFEVYLLLRWQEKFPKKGSHGYKTRVNFLVYVVRYFILSIYVFFFLW